MKAAKQYFRMVLFIMLYNVVLNFDSVDEILKCESGDKILKCDRSNESYQELLSSGNVYFAVEGGSYF